MTVSKLKPTIPDYRLKRIYRDGKETFHDRGPIVIPGRVIKELIVCDVATEPVFRAEIPDDGCIIVHLRRINLRQKPGTGNHPKKTDPHLIDKSTK